MSGKFVQASCLPLAGYDDELHLRPPAANVSSVVPITRVLLQNSAASVGSLHLPGLVDAQPHFNSWGGVQEVAFAAGAPKSISSWRRRRQNDLPVLWFVHRLNRMHRTTWLRLA